MKKSISLIFKIILAALILGLIILVIVYRDKLSVDFIMSYLPNNLLQAAIILILMYALKSLSVFFPILILQIAGGLIFPPVLAFIINCFGTAVAYTIPYIIGRVSGKDLTDKIVNKYKKAGDLIAYQKGSKAFTSFILRAVSCLPADIVSLYLGSIDVPYLPYIFWGVVGTLPGLIPATFMGIEMTNPKSPAFIISVVATVLSAVLSTLIYVILQKRKNK